MMQYMEMSEEKELQDKASYKDFDNINISTTTVIASTNLEIKLEWLYTVLPVTTIDISGVTIKTTKDFQNHVINLDPPYGSITMVQYKNDLKGFKIMKKKKKFFRNALSIVMYVGKLITIKIPTKGKLQMTGCITDDHSELCIKYFWDILSKLPNSNVVELGELESYKLIETNYLQTTLRTVMTDIVFNLGFNVNRQNLDRYMNRCTDFNSLLETSFGYTGVNIKIPFELDNDIKSITSLKCNEMGTWEKSVLSFGGYLKTLETKDHQKEISKKRRNTFLVFHSGTAIMSGMTAYYMKDVYNKFNDILQNARDEIEEHIVDTLAVD